MVSRSVTGKILSYIDAHPDQDLTLERLAEELHYSKFYMARTFKADTGMTLCKYIQGRRPENWQRRSVRWLRSHWRQAMVPSRPLPGPFAGNTDVRPGRTEKQESFL